MPGETTKWIIEIATSDHSTTAAAVAGGADRIELCANLAEGGTTPSLGTLQLCREKFDIALFPIIRPRGGDFLYTAEEFSIMLKDVKLCRQLGCNGVVIGLLNTDGTIDIPRTAALVNAAYPMDVTFHRAFDRCADPFAAMEQLIELGCTRILTSGQQPSVVDGVELVAALQQKAADRIIIMPGSGVRPDNIKMLAEKTGCVEFHSSLRGKTQSQMAFIHPAFKDSAESYTNNAIDPEEVRQLRKALE
jgi:copper homeostasis protein